ncbi:MAG: Gfo/Idh/MocA family oxidoreductase [Firmicutes bacterium]|nr:Gfo/Idh/MocA family oxidoreductase [Bacillota bacterium]
MEKTIRWAMVGLGKISRRMLKAIRSVPGSEVVACASSSKERAEAYAKEFNIPNALTYQELADNPGLVDAVYIATHMNAHAKPTMMFLKKKIAVLCEKTFATSEKEAESMIQCSVENDTLLMEAMWTRFLPATLELQDILAGGKVGKILSTRGKFEVGIGHGPSSRVFNKAVGGGSILDVGIYPTTYTHMLLGVPEKIEAKGRLKKEVDVNCDAVFTYPGGVTATTRVSTEFLTLKEFYIIECEHATVTVPSFFDARKIIIKYKDKNVKKEVITSRGGVPFGRRGYPDGFTHEIFHFNDLIRRNIKESPVMTHEVTMQVMRMIDAQLKQVGVEY